MRRLAVLAFMGLVVACGGDDGPDGVGAGASASSVLRYESLSELTAYNQIAVTGVVRQVVDDSGSWVVSIDVDRTLWSQSGVEPISGALQYRQVADGAENVAPGADDEVIVFLAREDNGDWSAHGGANSRFRVDGGMVAPAVEGGVGVPANTDVAGFVALLTAPAPSSDTSDYGYGYGGGSY